ncbi:MAG TPA: serine hydrolase [Ornithinibacter sp.]|nr:serine hydrolase [Ornithinibacter sp.]
MTPLALDRRRLLAGGGAAAGLAVLAGCAPAGSDGPSAVATQAPTSASANTTATPSTSASPSPTASATPAAVRRVEAPKLAARLDDYLGGRSGDLGLELVDLRRGQSFRFDAEEGYCYSTIKVLVLTTLLHQRQEDDKQLSARQRSLAERMITRSDNVATESLLAEVGRDEVRRIGDLVGMDHTHMDDGWWGLWRTTPGDLNRMVGAVLSSDAVLDGSRRAVARFLMADVIAEQRWGVFAPESNRVHVAAKNGWGPLPDGYRLNSAGWVSADDREYQLAILSNSPDGFRYGRRTISEVADICHRAMAHGLA